MTRGAALVGLTVVCSLLAAMTPQGSVEGTRVAAVAVVAAPASGCSSAPRAVDRGGSLVSDGIRRTYWLHVPHHLRRGQHVPLVLFFHQLGADGESAASGSDMVTAADHHGFILVYPNGTGSPRSWNVGPARGGVPSTRVDDVRFASQLIAQLSAQLCLDPRREYASGFSMGAGMAYRLACDLSGRIAAIAPADGPYVYNSCHPRQPVSVIAFHGDLDTSVLYHGDGKGLPDIPGWARGWAHRDGCVSGPTPFFHGTDPFRTYAVVAVRYTGCRSGAQVQLYTVKGGAHQWPPAVGPMGRAVPPAEIIWRFFASHPQR